MSQSADPLEVLWDALLSREAARIQAAYRALDPAARREVLAHLKRMASEDDWHPEQRRSALDALAALQGFSESEKPGGGKSTV